MHILIERGKDDPVIVFPETGAKVMMIESLQGGDFECDVATFIASAPHTPNLIVMTGTRGVCARVIRELAQNEFLILLNQEETDDKD